MKLKHTQARKARRGPHKVALHQLSDPVWLRRLRGEFGADHKDFDEKHPRLAPAVDGLKARIQAQQRTTNK